MYNYKEIQESIRKLAEMQLATIDLLVEKGVFTQEEWDRSHNKAISALDQHLAKKQEEFDAKMAACSFADQVVYKMFGTPPDGMDH